MSNTLIVWGAGGHGKVVLDVARSMGCFEHIAFVDDDSTRAGKTFCGCEVMYSPEVLHRFPGCAFVVAVGNNSARARCFNRAVQAGLLPTTLIHPRAIVAPSAVIELGTVIMPIAVINADSAIGQNCIINTAAVVEHDCRIAAHVHISPRAVLGGSVTVEPFAHIGMGAVVLPGAIVGEECIVGAGAVVIEQAPARCTVAGVPARALASA